MIFPVIEAKIRQWDSQGNGRFAARRGHRPHYGEDIIIEPGQVIFAPQDGLFKRVIQAYSDDPGFKGVEIVSGDYISRVLYVDPKKELLGEQVKEGQVIGYAQEIARRYPGITDHIHLEIYIRPSLLIKEGV